MGTVYAKGGRLYIGWKDVDGTWRYTASGLSVGEEAEARGLLKRVELRVRKEAQLLRGPANLPVTTLAAFAEQWLASRERLKIRDVRNERTRLRLHVLPTLGSRSLDSIKVKDVKALVLRLREAGKLASRSVHHVYQTLHNLLAEAVSEELIEFNPCQLRKNHLGPKRDKDPEWRSRAVYTRDELEALISDERLPEIRRVFYGLLGLAGLRHGEAAGLCWRHLDTGGQPLQRLMVAHSYEGETKTKTTREVPVHPALASLLARWQRFGWPLWFCRRPELDDMIVPTELGTMRQETMSLYLIKQDLVRLGLRKRDIQSLRRTFISLAQADGAIRDVVKSITHTSRSQVIDLYTIFDFKTKCTEVAKLNVGLRAGVVTELRTVEGSAGRTTVFTTAPDSPAVPSTFVVGPAGLEASARASGLDRLGSEKPRFPSHRTKANRPPRASRIRLDRSRR